MALQAKTIQIGGASYRVTQLDAFTGLRLFHRLGRTVGPAFAQMLDIAVDVKSLAEMDLSELAPAVRGLFDGLTENDLEDITRTLLDTTLLTENNRSGALLPVFGLHFAGRYEDFFRLLWFALEVNYGRFFAVLLARFSARGAGPLPSEESTISSPPGPPGDSSSPAG